MGRALTAVLAVTALGLFGLTGTAAAQQRGYTYTISSEGEVYADLGYFAAVAAETLDDSRGWSLGGTISYEQVPSGGDFDLILASPQVIENAHPVCSDNYSCTVGDSVYINDHNWRNATNAWTHSLREYQSYVIVHEVGHWLDLGHYDCPSPNRLAYAMQQQSISLEGCLANVWPLIPERETAAANSGVSVNWSPIEEKYRALGQEASVLRGPVTWESATGDGRGSRQHFQRGSIFYSSATGAHEVHGAIAGTWSRLGFEAGPLGFPRTDELGTPDGRGRFNHFDGSGGGSIYWTPSTGAQEVYGDIRTRWERLGWERGALGFPTTGERSTPDGRGRFNHFGGSGGGSIYWTPSTGAQEVYGDIRDRWEELGWERGALGFPTTGELGTPDGRGRFNHFDGSDGGSIYWTPSTGAQEVYGRIRDRWEELGWERSELGFPTSGEYAVDGGRRNDFENGYIRYDYETEQTEVRGDVSGG